MLNIKIHSVILYLLIVFTQIGYSQNYKKAYKNYDDFAFVKSEKSFKKLIEKGHKSDSLYAKLGNTCYFNSRYKAASKWYAKLFETNPNNIEDVYYLRYAQSLKSSDNHKKAAEVMKQYYLKTGNKEPNDKLSAEQNNRYTIKKTGINSASADFGTAFYADNKIIYATAKDSGIIIKRKHSWNEKPFFKLYEAKITADGNLKEPIPLKGKINSKYHQSSCVLAKDGKTIYFTGSAKNTENKSGINHLKIYSAENKNGLWENVTELPAPINGNDFSSAHPALSKDGSELYFVSDRGNSLGNTDLYVIGLTREGKPKDNLRKLGNEINTPGRETYPFIDDNDILYFATDGHAGFGGLDVFAAKKNEKGTYTLVNLGNGVNTDQDDFAYVIQNKTNKGYFSSNREGNDDIYSFTEIKPLKFLSKEKIKIHGLVLDSLSNQAIKGVIVEVYNAQNAKLIDKLTTDESGKFAMSLDAGSKYNFVFKKKGLLEKSKLLDLVDTNKEADLKVYLRNEMEINVNNTPVVLKVGDDLSEILKLKPIYFSYNGHKIREVSKSELQKVVTVLKLKPKISIKVNSYTDSRGNDNYNLKLSKERAKATVDYIISSGIHPDRVSWEGYGETKLVNRCKNGVKCSEKEHELNRRSEFIIPFIEE